MSNSQNPSLNNIGSTEKSPNQRVMSPCISLCTLDENNICVGCFRHLDEITGWHGASDERRQEILARCEARKA